MAYLPDKSGKLGGSSPGVFADIVAVQGYPLRDITALEQIGLVKKEGKVHKNAWMQEARPPR